MASALIRSKTNPTPLTPPRFCLSRSTLEPITELPILPHPSMQASPRPCRSDQSGYGISVVCCSLGITWSGRERRMKRQVDRSCHTFLNDRELTTNFSRSSQLRRFRSLCTVEMLRVTWEKTSNPYVSYSPGCVRCCGKPIDEIFPLL
jgi:hypothetical protein